MEDIYNKAIAVWIGRMTNIDPDRITNIKFDTIQGGYCETCEYDSMGLTYNVKTGKKGQGRKENNLEMLGVEPATFIREVSGILQTIVLAESRSLDEAMREDER